MLYIRTTEGQTTRWHLGPRLAEFGPEAGVDLYRVVGASRLGDGRVVVGNGGASEVLVFDGGGRLLGRLGGEGDGPGEYRSLAWVTATGGDTLLTYDSRLRRISILTGAGEIVGSFSPEPTGDAFFPEFLGTFADGEGGGIERLVGPDGVVAPFEAPDTSVVEPELSFGACPRWGGGLAGLLRANCRHLAFQQLTPEGDLVREVSVDRPPVLATDAELDQFEKRLSEMVGKAQMPAAEADRFISNQLEIARVKAVFQTIRADPATGSVYVLEETPFVLGGGPATLHAFGPGGRYLATVPSTFHGRTFGY